MMKMKTLGNTDIRIPVVGLGGSNLGFKNPDGPYDYYVKRSSQVVIDSELAIQTIHAALEAGVSLIDTAPLYQGGVSELNIAKALKMRPDLAKQVIVTTKIGRVYPEDKLDHSYEQAMRSYKESVARLGRDTFDILYIHDPMGLDIDLVINGTMRFMQELRKQGKVKWIGIAANVPDTTAEYIETGEFDVATVSGAWSLINQKAKERIFPAAEKYNVGLIATTVLERSFLVTGALEAKPYIERKFSTECETRVTQIKKLCDDSGIPLVAAALQWPTRHPQVACVIPGARTPEEARQNTLAGSIEIPEDFWTALEPLITHFDSDQEVSPSAS